ncbi:unnamed protein product [Allacma fusca]|uniref:Phorbol-ester/DAG-type domain-containing protein n=1 Tax=Allacma fusca TaxID=39272 RepID=A0A8J2KIS4_9HEXA|nr:unnamed protein product [Allacma fusca]
MGNLPKPIALFYTGVGLTKISHKNKKLPDHGLNRLNERLLLFRHDYSSTNILQMINSASEINDDTLVEIVLTGCGLNYHKRCVYKIPNNCSHTNLSSKRRRSSTFLNVPRSPSESGSISSISALSDDSTSLLTVGGLLAPSPSTKRSRSPSLGGRPPWIEREMAGRIKIPHTFMVHTYMRPTVCHYCRKLLKGVYKQGLQCKDCKYNAHKKCTEKIPKDCPGEAPKETGENSVSEQESFDNEKEASIGSRDSNETLEDDSDDSGSPPGLYKDTSPTQSVPNGIVTSILRKRHFWRLDTKALTLFQNDTGSKYYKEIPLSEILTVEPAKGPQGNAIDLINNLLQVKQRKRFTVDKSLSHIWLQQCSHSDSFENRIGTVPPPPPCF